MMKKINSNRMRDYDRMLFSESIISLFWAVIKERRRRGKFTLQSLADAAGIDKSKVSRDFSGTPNWQLNTMADYGSALGVDLEIRARDRVTGAIITPSGPVEAAYLLGASSGHPAKSTEIKAESTGRLIEVVQQNCAVVRVRMAVS